MQTIAIVNEKGGTGKTTTAVNFSAALGEAGRKVLLVDLDGQAASSRWLGVEENSSFADALCRGEGLEPIPEVVAGVSLAPGSGKLDSVAHDLRPTQGGQLRKLLAGVSGFDYTVIDCPPSLGNRLIGNALLAATHAIVPVETSILALDGLRILLTTLEDVREGFGHEIILVGVLACRYDPRTKLSRFVVDELKRALPGKVFQTVIRENVRVRECPASGQSILTFAPQCHAAEDYRALAAEFMALQDEAARPVTHAEGDVQIELTPEEQQAVDEMRQQADTMLHGFGAASVSQAAAEPAEAAPPEAGEDHEATPQAEPAETAPAAAGQPTEQPPTAEQAPPPPEAPDEAASHAEGDIAAILGASAAAQADGQNEQTDAEADPYSPARTDGVWDLDSEAQDFHAPQAGDEDEQSRAADEDSGAADEDSGAADEQSPDAGWAEAPPAADAERVPEPSPYEMASALQEPPAEQAPAPETQAPQDHAWQARPTGWEDQSDTVPNQEEARPQEVVPPEPQTPPADQPIQQAAPAEDQSPFADQPPTQAAGPEEAPTPEAPAEAPQQYPALRNLLRDMSGPTAPAEATETNTEDADRKEKPPSGWRRLFHKPAGVK